MRHSWLDIIVSSKNRPGQFRRPSSQSRLPFFEDQFGSEQELCVPAIRPNDLSRARDRTPRGNGTSFGLARQGSAGRPGFRAGEPPAPGGKSEKEITRNRIRYSLVHVARVVLLLTPPVRGHAFTPGTALPNVL